jgi:two-component system chemotaxis response regulator CheV
MQYAISTFTDGTLEIMEFEIDEKGPDGAIISGLYGISVSKVGEVIKTPDKISPTAKDHPAIEGVIELRGEVIPIINLPKWLEKYDSDFNYGRIIIVEFNMMKAGLLVSRVNRIYRVPCENFTPPTPIMRGGRKLITTGVVRNEGRLLLMLDYETMMADIDDEAFADPNEIPKAPLKGGRVLLVEDSGMVVTVLKKVFLEAGYSVMEAGNGDEALQALEIASEKWERDGIPIAEALTAVVTDVEMPLMDGVQFIAKLKADKRFQSLRVVIFSSVVTEEIQKRWSAIGVNAIIPKPMMSELVGYVNEFMATAGMHR